MQKRPQRMAVLDFAGRKFTLMDNYESWEKIGEEEKKDILLMGLGPGSPEKLPFIMQAEQKGAKVYWLDTPEMLLKRQQCGLALPPEHWICLDKQKAIARAGQCILFFYKPLLRMNWEYWGDLLGIIEAMQSGCFAAEKKKSVWLPGNFSQLLHFELSKALKEDCKYNVIDTLPKIPAMEFCKNAFVSDLPEFVLSVNFRGLDPEGRLFKIFKSLNIPVAIWLVDNPWHLLSAIKLPWWREAGIFVTDPGFIGLLKEYGAKNVQYCPLAAAQHMRQNAKNDNFADYSPLFAGRSAFPGKESFFAGAAAPKKLCRSAACLLEQKGKILPDYHWWHKHTRATLWPGFGARNAGLGAENCSMLNRSAWLNALVPFGLKIIGDAGWQSLLPQASIMPPVDYYDKLPQIYNNAFCVMNITSLLLPSSLNQRHFDVWASGGFLFSDNTTGLELFPPELTEFIRLKSPEEFGPRFEFLKKDISFRQDLINAWQNEIRHSHQYHNRLEFICNSTGI